MLEWIKGVWQSYNLFCQSIGAKIGIAGNVVVWLGIGLVALILALIILTIVLVVKKSKKKKRKLKEEQSKVQAKENSAEPVQEKVAEPVDHAEKNLVEVKTAEPVEEKVVEPVEEKVEEVKEQPIAEPAIEEVQEQPVAEVVEEKPVEEKKPAKKAPAKKTAEKKADKPAEKTVKKLNGKWSVEIKRAGEYVSKLTASNGEVMLYSETYTTEDGARNGILTIIKGLETGKAILYQDKSGNYYTKIKTANNRLLCVGEIYKSKDQCLKAIETVKRIAPLSSISPDLVEGERYIEYTPAPIDETKKTIRGKWKIEETEEGKFVARLYASNGQLMLATEEVANKATAVKAVESVKKNAKEGNFIIDRDKFKRYYYKLRNVQRSVICIGEAYESLDSCVSAIESVRRFALSSNIVQ